DAGEFDRLHVSYFVVELLEVPRFAVLPSSEGILQRVAVEALARVLLVAPAAGASKVLDRLPPILAHDAGYQDEPQRDDHREGQRRWDTLTHSTHHNGSTRLPASRVRR